MPISKEIFEAPLNSNVERDGYQRIFDFLKKNKKLAYSRTELCYHTKTTQSICYRTIRIMRQDGLVSLRKLEKVTYIIWVDKQ